MHVAMVNQRLHQYLHLLEWSFFSGQTQQILDLDSKTFI